MKTVLEVEMPAGCLHQENVSINEDNAMECIMTQKWLASKIIGYEAWFDYLGRGLTEWELLLDNSNPTAPGENPSHYDYPESTRALHQDNYSKAVENQPSGKDDINTTLCVDAPGNRYTKFNDRDMPLQYFWKLHGG